MPLGWFSRKENKVYHVCLNCPYEDVFNWEFVEIRREPVILETGKHQLLELYESCKELRKNGM